jgi:hypothetical protein
MIYINIFHITKYIIEDATDNYKEYNKCWTKINRPNPIGRDKVKAQKRD